MFKHTGAQFCDAFDFARELGVKTCIGTEAPLTLRQVLQQRISSQGKDPSDPATVREVYEGTFKRIMVAHPLDYYWIWTPEGWTWSGNKPEQYAAMVRDLKLAYEAKNRVDAPLQLATAGWVLGPGHHRAALDNDLPKGIPVSAISRNTGATKVDPAFARVAGREKWAIPWLESDNREGLAAPQLFVGRMRRDVADALSYRCTGLMGLHWRTRILGPNASTLAAAAWDQSGWNPSFDRLSPEAVVPTDGPLGGAVAAYRGRRISGTADALLYQTCRYNFEGYNLKVPNGQYRVTLGFCEPHFDYWLNTFKYCRSLAQLRCALARPDSDEISRLYADAYRYLLATVNTPGGLATVVNMEIHPGWGPSVAKHTDQPWPTEYQGKPRLIVPTVRTLLGKGEDLQFKVIVLDNEPPQSAMLHWRPLGTGQFQTIPLQHVAHAVYQVELPSPGDDFEYRIEATTANGTNLRWPVTAPEINQTVLLWNVLD